MSIGENCSIFVKNFVLPHKTRILFQLSIPKRKNRGLPFTVGESIRVWLDNTGTEIPYQHARQCDLSSRKRSFVLGHPLGEVLGFQGVRRSRSCTTVNTCPLVAPRSGTAVRRGVIGTRSSRLSPSKWNRLSHIVIHLFRNLNRPFNRKEKEDGQIGIRKIVLYCYVTVERVPLFYL